MEARFLPGVTLPSLLPLWQAFTPRRAVIFSCTRRVRSSRWGPRRSSLVPRSRRFPFSRPNAGPLFTRSLAARVLGGGFPHPKARSPYERILRQAEAQRLLVRTPFIGLPTGRGSLVDSPSSDESPQLLTKQQAFQESGSLGASCVPLTLL